MVEEPDITIRPDGTTVTIQQGPIGVNSIFQLYSSDALKMYTVDLSSKYAEVGSYGSYQMANLSVVTVTLEPVPDRTLHLVDNPPHPFTEFVFMTPSTKDDMWRMEASVSRYTATIFLYNMARLIDESVKAYTFVGEIDT